MQHKRFCIRSYVNNQRREMDNLKAIYEEQCRELNMDHDTEEKAWTRFVEVARRFTLNEKPKHWFACTLYASCRETRTPTVGSADAVVMGNCVSLTKLLRCCNISIYEFISKIKRWHEMAKLPDEFRNQIELLERNFSITFFLYGHYKNIFRQLFAYSGNDKKSPKFRSTSKCSFGKLYDLCWYLFLCVKNESRDTTDLVKCFHFLICCIDVVYRNVLMDNRVDLLNQNFMGYPKKIISAGLNIENIEDCGIFEKICELAQVALDDAKVIKEGAWRSIMDGFFDSNTIYGDKVTFMGISSNQNFDRNLKSLNCSYEQYILSVGTFDERILLNNQSNFQAKSPGLDELGSIDNRQAIAMSPDMSSALRRGASGCIKFDVDTSTEKVRKLLEITQICQPSEYLRIAGEAVLKKINEKLSSMCTRLYSFLPNAPEYEQCMKIIRSLYYNLLEKIIRIEVNNKPHLDLKILLDTESFHTTLIICCAEIVLNSYNLDFKFSLKFPWILDCYKIDAFNFYRIIELVVGRHDNLLERSHIRHLNFIEESCLELLSWQSSSTLWDVIAQNSQHLPAWIDVDANTKRTGSIQHTNSPINSAFDTFNAGPSNSDSARKDLFNTSKDALAKENGNSSNSNNNKINKTERLRSLNIFFRKFYKLAWLRIKELCKDLNMENESSLKKIWTLFEYSIMKYTELMRDRHLDQIFMCAIYIYIRVTEHKNHKFTDIMKAYRNQPQAASSIYREVLIEPADKDNDKKPKYNDLIYFYNNIYVQNMSPYAMGFSRTNTDRTNLFVSPHPSERQSAPKKISSNHKIFVSPMEKMDIRHSPDSMIFDIGSSPAKDLQRMNDAVKRGKRKIPFTEDSTATTCKEQRLVPSYFSTIQGILNDRQSELS